MGLFRFFLGTQIAYKMKQVGTKDAHGEPGGLDYDSYRQLASSVADAMDEYPCPACGCRKVKGEGVVVEYGKVHLYRQVETRGFFGGRKYKDKFHKTVWRVHQVGLRNAPGRALLNFFALFDPPPGKIQCHAKGCGWSESGERGGTISFGELLGRR